MYELPYIHRLKSVVLRQRLINENYRPCKQPNEDGKTFADRAIRTHYNVDNYQKGAATEFNKIQKFGDRGFE